MKAIVILYLKAFLLFALPFGAMMTIFDLVTQTPNPEENILKGVVYGFFMAATLVTAHVVAVRHKHEGPLTNEILQISQKKMILSPLPKNVFMDRLIEDPAWNKYNISTTENEIEITTTPSVWTWGEKIKILVRKVSDELNEFEVTSAPDARFALVDYGKGLQNVNRIEKLITA